MTRKTITLLIVILILLLAGGGYYYWFEYRTEGEVVPPVTTDPQGGFVPINRDPSTTPPSNIPVTPVDETPTQTIRPNEKMPVLRKISTNPVGGASASTTATTTIIRYIDRGVGHVFETSNITSVTQKLSNTTLPRVYESYWNKNLNELVLRYIKQGSDTVVNFYAKIQPRESQASTTSETPYEIKGKFLSSSIQEVAVSPQKTQLFTFSNENGKGIGYISNFDESKKVKIFDTPFTQVTIEWPSTETLALTTKSSGVSTGFAYSVDAKSGVMKKILGNIVGLSTKVSKDAKKVFFSSTSNNQIKASVYSIKENTTQDAVFRTLADKCIWSSIQTNEIYCAVPIEFPQGIYPDDWYKGKVSFVDQIWHLDTTTGEVHLLANLISLSDTVIDATNLTLDPKENYLYFINKRDLSLWSLDLNN